jgi:hypothetical protein
MSILRQQDDFLSDHFCVASSLGSTVTSTLQETEPGVALGHASSEAQLPVARSAAVSAAASHKSCIGKHPPIPGKTAKDHGGVPTTARGAFLRAQVLLRFTKRRLFCKESLPCCCSDLCEKNTESRRVLPTTCSAGFGFRVPLLLAVGSLASSSFYLEGELTVNPFPLLVFMC